MKRFFFLLRIHFVWLSTALLTPNGVSAQGNSPLTLVVTKQLDVTAAQDRDASVEARYVEEKLQSWRRSDSPIERWIGDSVPKLLQFLPPRVSGLLDHLPWEPPTSYFPSWESYVHHEYLGFEVEKSWGYDDPALVQQVLEAQKRLDTARQALNTPENVQRFNAMAEARQALNAQYLKQYDDLWHQGKQKEALELMDKRAKDPALKAPAEYEEVNKLDQQVRDLKAKGRKMSIAIQVSYPPLNWPMLKQIGAMKGYPLFRGVQQDVFLDVYLGPKGFR